jgi:hypothetical protein
MIDELPSSVLLLHQSIDSVIQSRKKRKAGMCQAKPKPKPKPQKTNPKIQEHIHKRYQFLIRIKKTDAKRFSFLPRHKGEWE